VHSGQESSRGERSSRTLAGTGKVFDAGVGGGEGETSGNIGFTGAPFVGRGPGDDLSEKYATNRAGKVKRE